jgi:Fe-Mn family superoxide dismutase
MPTDFRRDLERSFGSIETLRAEFIATANAMFGPGFVWLVQTSPTEYSILATYLAGSPYPQAHWRRQDTDMNTTGAQGTAQSWLKNTQVRGMPQPRGDHLPPGGAKANPLLCLNTWEHVWLRDY